MAVLSWKFFSTLVFTISCFNYLIIFAIFTSLYRKSFDFLIGTKSEFQEIYFKNNVFGLKGFVSKDFSVKKIEANLNKQNLVMENLTLYGSEFGLLCDYRDGVKIEVSKSNKKISYFYLDDNYVYDFSVLGFNCGGRFLFSESKGLEITFEKNSKGFMLINDNSFLLNFRNESLQLNLSKNIKSSSFGKLARRCLKQTTDFKKNEEVDCSSEGLKSCNTPNTPDLHNTINDRISDNSNSLTNSENSLGSDNIHIDNESKNEECLYYLDEPCVEKLNTSFAEAKEKKYERDNSSKSGNKLKSNSKKHATGKTKLKNCIKNKKVNFVNKYCNFDKVDFSCKDFNGTKVGFKYNDGIGVGFIKSHDFCDHKCYLDLSFTAQFNENGIEITSKNSSKTQEIHLNCLDLHQKHLKWSVALGDKSYVKIDSGNLQVSSKINLRKTDFNFFIDTSQVHMKGSGYFDQSMNMFVKSEGNYFNCNLVDLGMFKGPGLGVSVVIDSFFKEIFVHGNLYLDDAHLIFNTKKTSDSAIVFQAYCDKKPIYLWSKNGLLVNIELFDFGKMISLLSENNLVKNGGHLLGSIDFSNKVIDWDFKIKDMRTKAKLDSIFINLFSITYWTKMMKYSRDTWDLFECSGSLINGQYNIKEFKLSNVFSVFDGEGYLSKDNKIFINGRMQSRTVFNEISGLVNKENHDLNFVVEGDVSDPVIRKNIKMKRIVSSLLPI